MDKNKMKQLSREEERELIRGLAWEFHGSITKFLDDKSVALVDQTQIIYKSLSKIVAICMNSTYPSLTTKLKCLEIMNISIIDSIDIDEARELKNIDEGKLLKITRRNSPVKRPTRDK
jgi:hypothetical protein